MSGEGRAGGGAGGTDLEKLREQYQRQLQQTRELAEQMRRDDPGFARGGGGGFTFDAPTSVGLSAPGTEAFKQDRSGWESLRKNLDTELERYEASLSDRMARATSDERFSAGGSDRVPDAYSELIARYFESLAKKKK